MSCGGVCCWLGKYPESGVMVVRGREIGKRRGGRVGYRRINIFT